MNLLKNVIYVYKGVAKYKPYLILLLFLSLICTAGSKFIWLFLSKYVIEYIEDGMQSAELICTVLILTISNILCMVGLNAVSFGKEPAAFYVRPMFMLERNKMHIGMFYENLENSKVLDALEKSKNATRNVDVGIEGIIRFTLECLSGVFTCVVAVIILMRLSVFMAIFIVAFGLMSYLSIRKASRIEKELTSDNGAYQRRKLEYFKNVSSDFSYGKDIRLYQLKDRLMSTQKDLNNELHENVCKAKRQWIKSSVFTNTLDLLREGILYAGLVYFIMNGRAGIADFLLYTGCAHNLADALSELLKSFAKLSKCSLETDDYRAFNDFCALEEKDADNAEPVIKETYDDGYEIRFENVSFKYPESENYALRDLNITLKPHEKLAVVGLNGAGKTTFVKLMLKLYRPTEGKIYLNGRDINTINTKEYYRLFAPVFQDMECYAFSLAENISMQADEVTDKERALQCLKDAGLEDEYKKWKDGMDTPVLRVLRDDGIELSGGGKQKLALARALYKDAPLVILDEPTAALDALAESSMYERFDALTGNKGAVYISHRLASTGFCDAVALFEDGRMVEYGTHKELLEKKGKYAAMFNLQAQYYREECEDEAVG